MVLIVGLGNPGRKYKNTRHNIGSRVLDEFQRAYSCLRQDGPTGISLKFQYRENNFPPFKISKKFNSLISEGKISGKKILLAKPQTFMNQSGIAVKGLIKFYKITRTGLVVIHDDIDLPLGKIRIVKNRGSAGHKGVESIIKELGSKKFVRFRIGIQPQKGKSNNPEKPSTRAKLGAGLVPHRNEVSGAGFVLQKFFKEEEKIIKKIIKTSCDALKTALTEGTEKAMTKFNKYG